MATDICRVVSVVSVPTEATGNAVFTHNEYVTDDTGTHSVRATEVVKFRTVTVDGVELKIAVSQKSPVIQVCNVALVRGNGVGGE